jgi:hypothetical protein
MVFPTTCYPTIMLRSEQNNIKQRMEYYDYKVIDLIIKNFGW